MTPAVTVLLAVHNGGPYLQDAVQSVLDQTYEDFELLVVDDASDDDSREIVRAFSDPRIRLVRNERNLGQVPSLNRGLQEARGAIVARLDHDDRCLPKRLELQVEALEREPQVALVGGWMELVDEHDRPLGTLEAHIDDYAEFVYWTLVQHVLISHPAAAYRRSVALEIGGYDASLAPSEDKDLWRRFLLARAEARIVPAQVVRYRIHPAQLSQTRAELQLRNDDLSQEALLARLAPTAPAGTLRMLLSGDPAAWSQRADGTELAAALDAVVEGCVRTLGLGPQETAKLERLLAERLSAVVLSGWRGDTRRWRESSAPVLDWAARRAPRRGLVGAYRGVRLAAPALHRGDRLAGRLTRHVADLPQLESVRAPARRSPRLRAIYSRLVRKPK